MSYRGMHMVWSQLVFVVIRITRCYSVYTLINSVNSNIFLLFFFSPFSLLSLFFFFFPIVKWITFSPTPEHHSLLLFFFFFLFFFLFTLFFSSRSFPSFPVSPLQICTNKSGISRPVISYYIYSILSFSVLSLYLF